MSFERNRDHVHVQPLTTPHDDVSPGRNNRASQLEAPAHPVISGLIQRKARDASGVADGAEQAVAGTAGSTGQGLPAGLLDKFSSSLGADLSSVRVHTGAASASAASAVGAKAYTLGQDIHFADGQFDPGSRGGQHLLAHEVAHTVQQQGATPWQQNKLEVSSAGDAHEHAADAAADAMVEGRATSAGGGGAPGVLHRTPDPAAQDPAAPGGPSAGGDDVDPAVRAALAGLEGSAVEGSCNVTTETLASKIFIASGGKVKPDRVYNNNHYVLKIGDTIIDPTAAQFVNYPAGQPAPILVGSADKVRGDFAKLVDQYKIRHDSQKQAGAPFVPSSITSPAALADFAYGGGTVRQYGDALVARASGKKADYNDAKNDEVKATKAAEAAAPAAAKPAAAPAVAAVPAAPAAPAANGVSAHPIVDVGAAPAGPIAPSPVVDITASQGAKVDARGVTQQPVTNADPAAAVKELQPKLAAQSQAARAAYQPLAAEQAKLEDAIAAAPADQKPALQAQKQLVDDKLADNQRQRKQVDADLEAIGDPRSTPDTYNQILARQKSGVSVASGVEVDHHDGELEAKWAQNHDTTTTTGYADGVATRRTDDRVTKVGADGYSQNNTRTNDVVTADGKTSNVDSRTSRIGLDGLSYDKSVKQTDEKDGKTSGVEDKTAVKLGPGGASRTDTKITTNADGSSDSHARSQAIERGDGKLGVASGSTDVTKDAAGNQVTDATKVKGGMIAGKDGYGGYGEAERAYEKKNASGMKTGAVAGLNGNVTCNIEQVPGSDPAKYRVSLTVNLGAKLGASAGYDKEGSAGSAGVGVSASGTVALNRTYTMTDAEAKDYVDAIKAANAGAPGAGDKKELAIISAGVTKGWPAARDLYVAATKGAADPAAVNQLKDGESIKVEKADKLGAQVDAGGKGESDSIGGNVSYEVGHSSSMEVSKQDGKLTYNAKQGDSDKLGGGVNVGVGPAVSGGIGASHTNITSTGYKIQIDPADPRAGEMQAALARCKTQADLDDFATKYHGAVQDKTKQTATADTQNGSISVLGAKAGINFNQGIDEQVTTDGDGKFKSKTTTGTNGGGVELAIGDHKIGASQQDTAVAQTDADGNATVDVSRSTTDTNAAKWLGANVPFAGDKPDQGTLAKLAGDKAATDTDDHDVAGMKLKGNDLSYLGQLACNDWGKWMSACPSTRQHDDWAAAGRAIRAGGGDKACVADALAKFVGSGGSSEIVYGAVRSPGDVTSGARYEFPGTLPQFKSTYDSLVITDSELGLDAIAKTDGKDKAISQGTTMVSQLDSLYASVGSASGFTQPAVQAEMLAAINDRREKLKSRLRVINGGKADQLSPAELLEKYNALVDNCVKHQQTETDCFAKIEDTYKDGGTPSLNEGVDNATLIKQLRDMYALWNPEYDQMAALAQENGFGKDNYWKFKPDTARFNRALAGRPGAASAPQPETADKRKKEPVAQAPRDPVGDASRELDKKREAQSNEIQGQIGPAKNKAYGAGNRLFAWIQTNHNAAAIDAHGRGMDLLHRADGEAAKLPKNATTQDFESWGFVAVQDYNAAVSAFGEGLALYPAGSPPRAGG